MKRIILSISIFTAILSVNAAKAQVGVRVGLNFGTPYYEAPRRVVVAHRSPVYYQEQVYGNSDPVYYNDPREVYYQQEYNERLRERRNYYHRMHEIEEHGYYGRGYRNQRRDRDDY